MNLMAAAIDAVNRGWWVFPVEPNAKTPHLLKPDRPWTIKWSEVATNDIRRVVDIWTWSPDANIGVACKQSGLLVVDCDTPKRAYQLKDTPYAYLHDLLGPLVDGESVFDQCCERYGGNWGEASSTYTVATGSGGRHYYYRWPDGVQASQASIVKGILDVRGNGGDRGGYVLGAGSQTTSGSYVVANTAPVRECPAWLVELCRDKPHAQPVRDSKLFSQPRSGGKLGGPAEAVRLSQEGSRNSCLHWAAYAVALDGFPVEEVLEVLTEAYLAAGGDGGQRQAEQTIRSAYRNALK